MLDQSIKETLETAIRTWGEMHTPLDDDQQSACFQALEFLLNARVVNCSIHLAEISTKDGLEVTSYCKVCMEARLKNDGPGIRKVRRTVAVTKESPIGQILRTFGNFDSKLWGHIDLFSTVLKNLIPKKHLEGLTAQLTVKLRELEEDDARQAVFKDKLEVAERMILQNEQASLLYEFERLLRRGWTKKGINQVWDEALVKGVMES